MEDYSRECLFTWLKSIGLKYRSTNAIREGDLCIRSLALSNYCRISTKSLAELEASWCSEQHSSSVKPFWPVSDLGAVVRHGRMSVRFDLIRPTVRMEIDMPASHLHPPQQMFSTEQDTIRRESHPLRLVTSVPLVLVCLLGASSFLSLPTLAQQPVANDNSGIASPATAVPPATGPKAQGEATPFPDLKIPPDATPAQLDALIAQAKALRPRNPHQYQAMQVAIRDASKALLKQLDKEQPTPRYQQAELDTIAASVAVMTFYGEDAQQKTLEQVHDFLKKRETLSMQDIQTGILAANMLEMQPNKQPARDTYQLLDDLLKEDEREEMQSLRLNLKASMRRLDLLGSKFELEAQALDGSTVQIADYAGKFLIVDFFATWCAPCLTEAPHLQAQYEKYKDKGLEVIAISIDTDVEALQKYLKEAQVPWPVIHDDAADPLQRLQMKFGISQLPTVLLLNKEGTVVSLEARGSELTRLTEMLFETPTPADPAPAPAGEPPLEQADSPAPADNPESPTASPETESLIESE